MMKVWLEVIKGPETGRLFEFTRPESFIVGRGHEAHFRLGDEDPYVSRRHFLLQIAPPKVLITQLSTTNPTEVNGAPIFEQELKEGDIIAVGYTQIKVRLQQEFATKTTACQRCATPITYYVDELPPRLCPRCERESESSRAVSPPKHRLSCDVCGADLTEKANSDGRAGDLPELVQYVCSNCVSTFRTGPNAGEIIGEYEVLSTLGKGGMGRVYKVYHRATGRILALKQVLTLMKELIRRFEREIRIMKEVAHPNILRCVETGVWDDLPFMVLELASKGNLEGQMQLVIKPEEAVPYICRALDGLEFIHRQGIVHRDIKPANILLQETEAGDLIPKLADFGLAKRYAEAGGTSMTRMGAGIGSLFYIPPEQIRDTRSVREPADLYSMGVTLYYLMTGMHPYSFPTALEMKQLGVNILQGRLGLQKADKRVKHPFEIVLSETPIPIRERKADIPATVATIVDKAIRKEIPARFQSAREFREALENSL